MVDDTVQSGHLGTDIAWTWLTHAGACAQGWVDDFYWFCEASGGR